MTTEQCKMTISGEMFTVQCSIVIFCTTGITGQDRRWYSTNRAGPSDARSRCRETPATCHFLRAALFPHREDWNGPHQNWLEQFEDSPEPASIRGAQPHALHRAREDADIGVRRRVRRFGASLSDPFRRSSAHVSPERRWPSAASSPEGSESEGLY